MVWESVVGITVFIVLVLLLGPEWWSSSRGTLKEKERKQEAARKQRDEGPSQPEK